MELALISVYDKTGIQEFARSLRERGIKLLATGSTEKALVEAGLPVTAVSEFTGTPEVMGGRVKTLHPRIFGGILSRRTPEDTAELEKIVGKHIDIVVVNLYPFEKEASIENIDIGGVTLLRAAAKNHEHVTVLSDPSQYGEFLEVLSDPQVLSRTRKKFAAEAFKRTSRYDAAIEAWLSR